ncbi:MAG: hypothetical protein AAFR53_12890 [Pseudomonadota bacterium]
MPTIVIGCAAPSFAAARAVAMFAAPAEAVPIDFSFAYIFDESTPVPSEPGVTRRGFNDVAVEDQGNVVANVDTTAPSGTPGDENVIAQINGLEVVLTAERTTLPGTPEVLGNLDNHVEIRDGTVAFFGGSEPDTILIGDEATTRVVAQEGETLIPFAEGTTTGCNLVNFEGFGFDGTRTAFETHGINGDFSNEGIFVGDDTGIITKILETSDAPDVALGSPQCVITGESL